MNDLPERQVFYEKFFKLESYYETVKGGCFPSEYKFKTQKYNKLRWLASDLNFKLLHTGCPNAHASNLALPIHLLITSET